MHATHTHAKHTHTYIHTRTHMYMHAHTQTGNLTEYPIKPQHHITIKCIALYQYYKPNDS